MHLVGFIKVQTVHSISFVCLVRGILETDTRRVNVLKNKVNTALWEPIVTEHPDPIKIYRKSETKSFLDYQPVSERYEVPGLMPRAPRRSKSDSEPY